MNPKFDAMTVGHFMSDPSRRCNGTWARDINGQPCNYLSVEAEQLCLVAAIHLLSRVPLRQAELKIMATAAYQMWAREAARQAPTPPVDLFEFNDSARHWVVLAAVTEAKL